jgi:hypothetical protein
MFLFKTSNVSYSIHNHIKKHKSDFPNGKDKEYNCENEVALFVIDVACSLSIIKNQSFRELINIKKFEIKSVNINKI